MSANPAHLPYPRSLEAAAALDQMARDLYVNRQRYVGEPVQPWDEVPYHLRSGFVEVAARTLKAMTEPAQPARSSDALFHLATTLARAEFATGLRPTHGKVVGAIGPKGGGAA